MIGRDLLFRGRGADVGVRAPAWLVRVAGAVLAVGLAWLADAVGVWFTIGVSRWMASLGAVVVGLAIAPTVLGMLLWVVGAILTAVLLLVMFTPIVRPLAATFVRADAPGDRPPDAVVVLSGSVSDDGLMTGQALDRLLSGMQLATSRRVPSLALSVVSASGQPGIRSEADQRALVAMAAPLVTPRFVHNVHSTRDEALAFAALARTHGWQHVIVVTSPMHSRRACAALEVAGLHVECVPAAGRDYAIRRLDSAEDRRLAFRDVVYESAATLLYRTRRWM